MTKDEALKLALEALKQIDEAMPFPVAKLAQSVIKEALAQPEQDNTYTYASSLATTIWQKHYIKDSPKWKPLDTTDGVLTQIDNMTCGLVKEKPAQPEQEPVAWMNDSTPSGIFARHMEGAKNFGCTIPLYTTPPQRKPLTDEQIDRLWSQSLADTEGETYLPLREFARAIEAAHGIKGEA